MTRSLVTECRSATMAEETNNNTGNELLRTKDIREQFNNKTKKHQICTNNNKKEVITHKTTVEEMSSNNMEEVDGSEEMISGRQARS